MHISRPVAILAISAAAFVALASLNQPESPRAAPPPAPTWETIAEKDVTLRAGEGTAIPITASGRIRVELAAERPASVALEIPAGDKRCRITRATEATQECEHRGAAAVTILDARDESDALAAVASTLSGSASGVASMTASNRIRIRVLTVRR
jgi:hypothetical protein